MVSGEGDGSAVHEAVQIVKKSVDIRPYNYKQLKRRGVVE